jgi:nitroreductase
VEAAGLGAVVMTAPLIAAQALKDTLDIPAKYSIGALVSMGYFDVKPPAPPHKPLQDVLRIID